ncbi:MAG TPA: aldo/keto reductase [Actinomycetales bacterium]|nr:aldo/keto reductase [Actinomycetales bacterium]
MEQRYVGSSGLLVSRLALGTMTWGRDTDEHESRDQLTAFLEAGGTLVDTAAAYGDGAAEELLGQLLAEVGRREDVVVCTKAGISRRSGSRVVDTSRRAMLAALDGSLRRLGTDHVDLWLAHTWSDDVPLEETLSALAAAVASGRARYAGISNYRGWQSARAATLADGRAAGLLVAHQVEYSLLSRAVEDEVAPAAEFLGLGLMAWSPLGRGVLTGKYRHGTPADSRAASPHFASFVERYLGERSRRVVDAVVTAAEGLGCSPGEIALAWVRDQPGVVAPVVGARTAAQLRGTLTSEEVVLPPQIRLALDEVSDPRTDQDG